MPNLREVKVVDLYAFLKIILRINVLFSFGLPDSTMIMTYSTHVKLGFRCDPPCWFSVKVTQFYMSGGTHTKDCCIPVSVSNICRTLSRTKSFCCALKLIVVRLSVDTIFSSLARAVALINSNPITHFTFMICPLPYLG